MPIIEVTIPLDAPACPGCGSISVNLDGEPVPCSWRDCEVGHERAHPKDYPRSDCQRCSEREAVKGK